MANKQLTASVRLNTTQFEQKLKRIAKGIDALNNTVGRQSNAYRQVNAALGQTDKITVKVKKKVEETNTSTKKWVNTLNTAASKLSNCKSIVGALSSKMSVLAGTLLGGFSVSTAIQGADTLTGAQNRFNNIAAKQLGDSAYNKDSDGNITGYSDKALSFTQDTMDKIYSSAQKTRTEYSDMLSNVSKTMTLAPDAFQGNIDNAIRFQEIMAEAYAVGGASAAEMSTSMYQLTQAVGAGILAGDELRSVREGAPLAYQKMEEFAQSVLNTSESLKDLASDGKITSDMIVAAVMSMGDEMDQAFALTKYRFTDVWNQIKSAAQKAFSPVVEMMTDKLNEMVENGFIQKVEVFFTKVAKAAMIAINAIEAAVNWIVDNWNWIKDVLLGLALAILIWESIVLVMKAVAAVMLFLSNKALQWALWVGFAIYALIKPIISFISGIKSLTEALQEHLLLVGVGLMVLAIMLGNGWVALAGGIVLTLWAIVKWFGYVCYGAAFLIAIIADVTSFIWNCVLWLVQAIISAIVWVVCLLIDIIQIILNVIFGAINSILNIIWAAAEPIISIVEWVLNVCKGGFDSFGGAVANLIGQIIGWFMNLGTVVTKIIDAIFGTNWTAGLNSLKDKVLKWGKNESAITINRESPEIKRLDYVSPNKAASNVWNFLGKAHTGYANPLDWGSSAMDWGNNLKDSIDQWGSKYQSDGLFNIGSWLDKTGEELGINDLFNNLTSGGDRILNPDDVDSLLKDLNSIGDNTDAIADSMELTNEDLEYLRKIAEMEWKKEYTTANITVDMSNYNTINGENDLDGIVTKLSDKLREELNVVANGVYD